MAFDISNPASLDAAANTVAVSDADFAARMAIGVRNKPRNGRTTWVILEIAAGDAKVDEVRELDSDDLPEDQLKVVLGISSTAATWGAVSPDADFLEAVADHKFFVTGETPFFIRHLKSFLEVLASFR